MYLNVTERQLSIKDLAVAISIRVGPAEITHRFTN